MGAAAARSRMAPPSPFWMAAQVTAAAAMAAGVATAAMPAAAVAAVAAAVAEGAATKRRACSAHDRFQLACDLLRELVDVVAVDEAVVGLHRERQLQAV